ncbi:MAG: HEAT repeat domain-containing protein [Caldilineaceae bacterium]|nr:HEAT repeat domain-containing protein [Caldilineaceae bacterium]
MKEPLDYADLINRLADKTRRNQAIVLLVGAINARDLAKVTLKPGAKEALIQGLKHANPKVRWWSLQLMDHLADESFIPHILSVLDDPVGKVRRHAVHALTCDVCKPDRCGLGLSASIRTRIEEVAQFDSDERVRKEASTALANWGRA